MAEAWAWGLLAWALGKALAWVLGGALVGWVLELGWDGVLGGLVLAEALVSLAAGRALAWAGRAEALVSLVAGRAPAWAWEQSPPVSAAAGACHHHQS